MFKSGGTMDPVSSKTDRLIDRKNSQIVFFKLIIVLVILSFLMAAALVIKTMGNRITNAAGLTSEPCSYSFSPSTVKVGARVKVTISQGSARHKYVSGVVNQDGKVFSITSKRGTPPVSMYLRAPTTAGSYLVAARDDTAQTLCAGDPVLNVISTTPNPTPSPSFNPSPTPMVGNRAINLAAKQTGCGTSGKVSITFTWTKADNFQPGDIAPVAQMLDYALVADLDNVPTGYGASKSVTGQTATYNDFFAPNTDYWWRINTDWGGYLGGWAPSAAASFHTISCATIAN
jgi:hypothetical protein